MKNFVAIGLILFCTASFADVFKCTSIGKITYSDIPCETTATTTTKVHVVPTSGFSQRQNVDATQKVNTLRIDPDSPTPMECKFQSYKYGDEKGKKLAENAKHECIRNQALKAAGRGNEASIDEYSMWKDHSTSTQARRTANRTINCMNNGFGGLRCN